MNTDLGDGMFAGGEEDGLGWHRENSTKVCPGRGPRSVSLQCL